MGGRVAWKGPSGYRCEGEAACVKEWHSPRWKARGPCTDLFEPNKDKGYPCDLCWREKPVFECADALVVPLLEESNVTGIEVTKEQPYFKPKGIGGQYHGC